MAPYWISHVRDVFIYPGVIGKNIIRTIIQALTTFYKTGTYVEQGILWILILKVWHQIFESQVFVMKSKTCV